MSPPHVLGLLELEAARVTRPLLEADHLGVDLLAARADEAVVVNVVLPSTSWRPATAGCCGGFIFRRYLLFLFGGIFGLLLRELLSLSWVVLSSHCTELYLGFPPTPACFPS